MVHGYQYIAKPTNCWHDFSPRQALRFRPGKRVNRAVIRVDDGARLETQAGCIATEFDDESTVVRRYDRAGYCIVEGQTGHLFAVAHGCFQGGALTPFSRCALTGYG